MLILIALREFRGAALLAVGNVSDLSGHRSMLKRAELVLKYLMKCIDSMKQMQESELHLTVQETLRNEIKGTPSIMLFPDDVIDLPCDPVKSVRGTTLLYNPNSTRIGRLPKRKILHSNYCQETSEQDVSEMSRFIDTKQTWRTRCTTIPTREESILDMKVKHEISNISESFDLTSMFFLFTIKYVSLVPYNNLFFFYEFFTRSFGRALYTGRNAEIYSI